ncbi:metal ABC transporter substrate-binding protein [Halosolutus amylolyticus]|uniref:Metal ABC transporter substrate-binding protein n=1 Tax=Halosolutus amylolyticus TaxID=2932267 RepID=A0ABD5PQW4_9EURY|nr:metal ABC transporter substrate-binding protein [Halosolutus amylolyticus]
MTNDLPSRDDRWSRRRVVSAVGGTAVAGLAGCIGSGDEDDSNDGPVAVASFFTFYDFARQIAAKTPVSVENLVPTGMHGHGWEPDPSIQRDITDADAFLHVGPDFQPWADRAIDTVGAEAQETHLINVREGVELIDLADSLDDDEAVGDAKDPHFWLDPELAMTSVDNIADGLAEIAPDHEETFTEHAAEVKSELETLDEEWQALFDATERDVLFLAAHNAFAYVAERYDVTIEPLVVNLAANDDVRPTDMQRAQETIAENDIQHIGAAVFEPIRPAQQLLEQTDVEAYYPVTPYAGTAESWAERGWGYFDIARNVNMPTFRLLAGAASPDEVTFEDYGRNFEP